ncbi:hypothetical protein QJQ45_019070, partial [Haematococcus lacustris]
MAWRTWARASVVQVGDSFTLQDDGPSEADLKREVEWLLEDVVEVAGQLSAQPVICLRRLQTSNMLCDTQAVQEHAEQPWEQTSWRELQPAVRSAEARRQQPAKWTLRLRMSVDKLHKLWHQRLHERAPLQYLTASAHWRDHVLAVGPGVLIPRPETEIFPDLVSAAVAKRPGLALLPWADLGTGSGAIAIGTAEVLARTCKAPRVLAVDFSPIAVAYAHANAAAAGRSHHVQVMQGSWYEPIAQHLAGSRQAAADLGLQSGKLGGVLSNPPYIPSSVLQAGLQAEVGRHEPSTALDGGPGAGMDSLK